MSLSISYELRLPPAATAERIAKLMNQLRESANQRGFEALSPVFRMPAPPGEEAPRGVIARHFSMRADIESDVLHVNGCSCDFGAQIAIGFVGIPGEGCEPAIFALLSHDDPKHLCGWTWRGDARTQYASMLGNAHFVRCHRAIIDVLGDAIQLGIGVVVQDDGHFWETRDDALLVAEVTRANRMVGGIGVQGDALPGYSDNHPEILRQAALDEQYADALAESDGV